MRLRTVLLAAFVFVTLVPSVLFGFWSYQSGIEREFSEVRERHQLIAESLELSLDRHRLHLISGLESAASALLHDQTPPNVEMFLTRLNIDAVALVEKSTLRITRQIGSNVISARREIDAANLIEVAGKAKVGETIFTPLIVTRSGRRVMYAVQTMQDYVAVAEINLNFFLDVVENIKFGKDGHALVLDRLGQVLAKPKRFAEQIPDNLSDVAAIQRVISGAQGVVRFNYPGETQVLIAGAATVSEAGWGIFIPQPIAEINAKVAATLNTTLTALLIGLSLAAGAIALLMRWLAWPLERVVASMKDNARRKKLSPLEAGEDGGAVREFKELERSYNFMVKRVNLANKEVERLAYRDSVTGLPNREKFQSTLSARLENDETLETGGCVVFVDMDNFKEVNDLHGHDVGDDFLRAVAATLADVAKRHHELLLVTNGQKKISPPMVSRIGGDEFTILMSGMTDTYAVNEFLDDIRRSIAQPTSEVGFNNRCSASIGCARYPDDATTTSSLIKRADIAMYHAKNGGKNRAELFRHEIGTRTEAEIRRDVLYAIENDELKLQYQPKVNAADRSVAGVEALVRWHHPDLGILPPNTWIPAIVNSHVIVKLGEWVVRQTIKDQAVWRMQGHELSVAVNIGSKHFIAPKFVEFLNATLLEFGLEAHSLQLEVTEDVLFGSDESAADILNRLRTLGYKVAIDDFGKGYSNLARLAQLPVDFIKLDRSIVEGAQKDPRVRSILATSIDLARQLGCKTIAEGVETVRQVDFVTHMGADMLQGYYFSKSLSSKDLLSWLNKVHVNSVHEQQRQIEAAVG